MGQISDIKNPWRDLLLSEQASFRGVTFHIESGSRSSGRRTVVHEYPKRNLPYSEDMGKHARRFSFSGYLVYRPMRDGEPSGSSVRYNYVQQRVRLIQALEKDDAGRLVHPVFAAPENGGMMVVVERYSMTEVRERGGYTQFEMTFVEAGSPGNLITSTDTAGKVSSTANAADDAAVKLIDAGGTP